jgi:glutathione S-transferase
MTTRPRAPHALYVIHGSHPCAAVERAFALKGIPYRRVELPPPMHVVHQQLRFGQRTVPSLKPDDGDKIVGSRAIMRWAERLVPEPQLIPAEPEQRARIEAAETWGDETYQPIARRLLWPAFARAPRVMASYQEGARFPVPAPVLLAVAPVVTRIERRLNDATDANLRADLEALPGHLDRIDAWIAEGVLGGEDPNVADLQIAATSRLLLTIGDVEPLFAGRPARDHALLVFPHAPGHVPAGVL